MEVHCTPPYLMWWWTQCYNTGTRWWKRKREGRTGAEVRGDTAVPFHANDGLVASTDPAWLQGGLNNLNRLFDRMGLQTTVWKTVGMVC